MTDRLDHGFDDKIAKLLSNPKSRAAATVSESIPEPVPTAPIPSFADGYTNIPSRSAGTVSNMDSTSTYLQPVYLAEPMPMDRLIVHIEYASDVTKPLRLSLYKQTETLRFEKLFAFGDVPVTPYTQTLSGNWVIPAGVTWIALSMPEGGTCGIMDAHLPQVNPDMYSLPVQGTYSLRLDSDKTHPAVLDISPAAGEGQIYSYYSGGNFWFRMRRA